MKRKNSNVLKLKNFFTENPKVKELYSKFKQILFKYNKHKSFAVAVSGGPDSMALVAMSNYLLYEKNYKFLFVIVDHGIRKNSYNEALNLRKILKKNNINLKILRNKKKIKSNIQKTARDIRYELLVEFCRKNSIKNLLVAHHQDDQVETFLIRLSRGSGVEGLSSMSEMTKIKYNIHLIRPFLDYKKKELQYVSKIIFGKTFKDPSNKNKKFLRTNIRELKRTLEDKGINFEKIVRSIKNISSSKEAINFYVERSIKKYVKFKKKEIILNLRGFKQEPKEVRFRIINSIIKKSSGSYYPPRSKKVLNLIKNFQNNNFIKSTLGGCIFVKKNNQLLISREF